MIARLSLRKIKQVLVTQMTPAVSSTPTTLFEFVTEELIFFLLHIFYLQLISLYEFGQLRHKRRLQCELTAKYCDHLWLDIAAN